MRKYLSLFFLLAASYMAFAGTITEQSFNSAGYKDFYINDANGFSCTTFVVNTPDLNGEVFPVFSLRAKFLPKSVGNPIIKVYLNDSSEPLGEYFPHNFSNGTVRIVLPREQLRASNNLKVCGKPAPENSIWINADSTFGLYHMPYFPPIKGLELGLETYHPKVGVPFELIATARNHGSEDAFVSLSYRRIDLREALPEASVLDGETSKTGVVRRCQKKGQNAECIVPGELEISYKAVANKPVPMTLLPAVMLYTNVFGEEEIVVSNRPNIGAVDTNRVVTQILLENDKGFSGQKMPIRVLVKNTGVEARNVVVILKTGLEVLGPDSQTVNTLREGETIELQFEGRARQAGTYNIGCAFKYEDREAECASTNLLVETQPITLQLVAAIALTLLGIAVFIYFYYIKKEQATHD